MTTLKKELVPIDVEVVFNAVFWSTQVSESLDKFNDTQTKWTNTKTREQLKTIVWPLLEQMPEEYTLAGGKKVLIKEVHYLAQLCRLSMSDTVTLQKLCQIALYVSQLEPLIDTLQLKNWKLYCHITLMYPELRKINTYTDAETLELFGATLALSGYCTNDILQMLKM